MPIREDDDGRLIEAFYPSTPIREGRAGSRDRPAVLHSLGGWEGPEELQEFVDAVVALMTKHLRSNGIGQAEVQWVLDWMYLVCERIGLDILRVVCDAALSRGVILRPRGQSNEDLYAKRTCEYGEKWYRGEHGSTIEHRNLVNALTLSFRL